MFLFLIVTLILIIYYVSIRKFDYWKIRKVPFIKPIPLIGNYGEIIFQNKNFAEGVEDICKKFPDEKFIGAFYSTEPVLIPIDPEIIKLIVAKDFYYFNGRELSEHSHKEPAALNIFSAHGDNWRVLRQNMTLLFSSGKMRNMFHLIEQCSYLFESMLDRETSKSEEIETRSVAAKFTIECIGACVFGVDANTMTEKMQDNPFGKIAALTSPTIYAAFKRGVRCVWPSIFYGLGLKLMSRQMDFFKNLITSVMNQRDNKPSGRNDFLDLILSWKQSQQIVGDSIKNIKTGGYQRVSLEADDDLLVAQCFVFFNAGFETSATILSYTLYELAKNEVIQNRVLEEVDAYMVRHDNKLCYECVTEFPYLWAAVGEAQRLYPVLGVIFRETMEDYTLPGGLVVEKGMRVHIPVYYLQHNPKYFPDPDEFRPERFYGEEKHRIHPYTYMPFGEGPRTCMVSSQCTHVAQRNHTMFLFLLVSVLLLIYYLTTRKYNYWKDRNVPHTKPTFLLGNYAGLILQTKSFGETIRDCCNKFPNEKFIGVFYGTEPVLIPKDPEIIKLIVTKDFYYFHGRELSEHSHKEPLALNLFGTYGDSWRVLRQNMTPLFSSAKMKNMFHLIEKCSHVFETMLDRETKVSKELEVRSLTSRYTMECIGACAFGVDTNTMAEEENDNPFRKITDFMDPPKYVVYMRILRAIWPSIFYLFRFQLLKTQLQFFHNLITSVMTQREYKSSGRHDFVDLVMSWKQTHQIVGDSMKNIKTGENHKVTLEATDDLLVAQCFIFFAAGFETSSTTLSYSLYEVAKNNDIQNKVLEEVDAYLARHENNLNYDCVSDLPYLEAVIDETLRFYPVLGMIPRELMEDYIMPGGAKLDKGMRVHLPVLYLHHNPAFYPEPEVFRPERFLGEEKRNINPYAYLPFGEGPRTCIGMRFAKMQMLAGLITILKKYRLELADGMPTKLTFKPQSFITHPVGGIRLKFVEREGWEKRVFVK